MAERYVPPEARGEAAPAAERELHPEEVEGFKDDMVAYIEGLRAVIAELADERTRASGARVLEIDDELTELREQLEGMEDSYEAIEEQGSDAKVTVSK